MTKYKLNLDSKTGQFLPIPKGQKPPKMIEMEKKLGLDFKQDFYENYFNGELGQKRFAQRWGVSKNLIFANNLRGGRRSWVQILDLEKKLLKLSIVIISLILRVARSVESKSL